MRVFSHACAHRPWLRVHETLEIRRLTPLLGHGCVVRSIGSPARVLQESSFEFLDLATVQLQRCKMADFTHMRSTMNSLRIGKEGRKKARPQSSAVFEFDVDSEVVRA